MAVHNNLILMIFLCSLYVSLIESSFPINYWNETGLEFDKDFIIYPRKNNSEKLLPYDPTHLCILSKINGSIFIAIKSVYEYSETIPHKAISADFEVHGCFLSKGKSFLWAKHKNAITSSELTSMPNKVQYINLNFEFVRFDVLSNSFLTYLNGQISLYDFLNFIKNPRIPPNKIIKTNSSCSDVYYIKAKIYCIQDKTIYLLNSNFFKYFSPYFTEHFHFLLFPKIIDTHFSNNSVCSSNSHLFLYLIDIFVIALLVIVFRKRIVLDGRFGNIRYSPPASIIMKQIPSSDKTILDA